MYRERNKDGGSKKSDQKEAESGYTRGREKFSKWL
ncbi:hypothetical protein LSS_04521 [Leptospira santarosai serovar Shermani str. LT 821]|uniref:Uncharacterized protein n=1 Tax=Leptospira santarosai serovar Shermani str. LT 821 TaxID=758847 RepID=K8Y4H2_9LEPT|nr:hypothetical protein LSS_04521 [Leptospira santarosai serovar Shermani str. LT 821]